MVDRNSKRNTKGDLRCEEMVKSGEKSGGNPTQLILIRIQRPKKSSREVDKGKGGLVSVVSIPSLYPEE